jgi:hypothetical protein
MQSKHLAVSYFKDTRLRKDEEYLTVKSFSRHLQSANTSMSNRSHVKAAVISCEPPKAVVKIRKKIKKCRSTRKS